MEIYYLWILIASIFGFSVSAIFAGWLSLPRNTYLLFYIPLSGALFVVFIYSAEISMAELLIHHWYWGLAGAAVALVIVVRNVLSQPSSPRNKGIAFLRDLLWPGFLYGLVDSLLLSVLPVLAIREALANAHWTDHWTGSIGLGAIALGASFLVTAVYHLGYPEFRNKKVLWTLLGNGVMTLAFLLTMNPLAAILPHVAMHITAMVHGRKTTGQVPPHAHQK
ncbi:MAG: hypothetical protein V2I54_07460 [Bacteroidales bacterium]|jgi:hypothetical protein|nr:hypothetical protein [Bacteroidales bacterium]